MLQDKNIILGISGGIAAYKSPLIIRDLRSRGAQVKVVCTENALEFTTLTTLETLSENPVYSDVFEKDFVYSAEHISISDWADMILIAPATGNIIGKFANGIADDALSTVYMAFDKKVFIAPAMNTKMYSSKAVQDNMLELKLRDNIIIGPDEGELACGSSGLGRMTQPHDIISFIENEMLQATSLQGKKVLISAGPTIEKIDPIRFISNFSSGKMGYALAEDLRKRGAEVFLISGPVSLPDISGVNHIKVTSAQEMHEKCISLFADIDIAVMAAAVADYRPTEIAAQKLKKESVDQMQINLVKNPDILADLGKMKKNSQVLIGFALETENEKENALKKLHNKNADFIVMNSLRDENSTFNVDTNKVSVIFSESEIKEYPLMSKKEIAVHIIDEAILILNEKIS